MASVMTNEETHAEIGRLVTRIVGVAKALHIEDYFPEYGATTNHTNAMPGQTILEALQKLDAELGTGPE